MEIVDYVPLFCAAEVSRPHGHILPCHEFVKKLGFHAPYLDRPQEGRDRLGTRLDIEHPKSWLSTQSARDGLLKCLAELALTGLVTIVEPSLMAQVNLRDTKLNDNLEISEWSSW